MDKRTQPEVYPAAHPACPDPKVAVIIPAYNSAATIAETLNSVFAQTLEEFEVVVINDGSPDTLELESEIAAFRDRITYVKQQNQGAAIARNAGIEHSNAPFVAFLDGDDIWLPEHLSSQLELLKKGGFDMVYCDAELFGTPSVEGQTFMQGSPSEGEVTPAALLDIRCNVITSGTVARRAAIEKAGMFESARVLSEDFHLWVRMATSGARIGYQRRVQLKYRVTSTGLSGGSVDRVRRAMDVFQRLSGLDGLSAEEKDIIARRIESFRADLAREQGKAHLVSGNFAEARVAFAEANRLRPSTKLSAVTMLSRVAPGILRRIYLTSEPAELALIGEKMQGKAA